VKTNIIYNCSEVILKSENGTAKIRSKIMIVRDNSVYAVCKSCGTEVSLPLTPTPMVETGPPLILRK
jgi:ribosomal protein S27E